VVASPPFPDQAVTLDNSDIAQPINAPRPDDNVPPEIAEIPTSQLNVVDTTKTTEDHAEITTSAKPDPIPVTTQTTTRVENGKTKTTKVARLTEHNKKTAQPPLATIKRSVAVVDELSKLKQAAWVIQIGSYKNKSNALRLVNQLRSNGYAAFLQEVSTEEGRHTRVYVGPLGQQKSALSLREQINKEMHLRGVVISYQPLAL